MANLSNITNAYAAPQIVATGTLAAGQTDIGLSVSFPVNQYPSAQIGSVLVYVNGQLLLRNTGNATASLTADGNYQEVDSGTGVSSLIRLNVADPLNARPYAILSNGFNVAQPASTIQSQIQTLQTQQDNMATTLAEVAGISVSSLYTPLNDATRATFASQFTTLQSDAALKNVSNTFTQPQLIPGRTDGATVPSGYPGETLTNAPGVAVSVAGSGVGTNVTSITLTPGVWLVNGSILATASAVTGGSWTQCFISTNNDGTLDANGTGAQIPLTASPTSNMTVAAVPRYFNISANTTVFLVGAVAYSTYTGTYATSSRIRAIRIA